MTKKMSTEEFIEKAKEKHLNKYDYSQVIYVNSNTKVQIWCYKHEYFFLAKTIRTFIYKRLP